MGWVDKSWKSYSELLDENDSYYKQVSKSLIVTIIRSIDRIAEKDALSELGIEKEPERYPPPSYQEGEVYLKFRELCNTKFDAMMNRLESRLVDIAKGGM